MVESITSEQFAELVVRAPGRVLVDFSATWCGPCRMLAPVLEQLAEEKAGQLTVYSVDVGQCPDIAGRLGINAVPTLLIYDNGKPVRMAQGALPIENLREFVEI